MKKNILVLLLLFSAINAWITQNPFLHFSSLHNHNNGGGVPLKYLVMEERSERSSGAKRNDDQTRQKRGKQNNRTAPLSLFFSPSRRHLFSSVGDRRRWSIGPWAVVPISMNVWRRTTDLHIRIYVYTHAHDCDEGVCERAGLCVCVSRLIFTSSSELSSFFSGGVEEF